MLEGLRRSTREKLQRALTEVVHDSDVQARHDQVTSALAAITEELTRTRIEVTSLRDRLAELEHRSRRDLNHALDVRASAESAAFVVDQMPTTDAHWHPHDTLRAALAHVEIDGLALEFGVASGTTLGIIAETLKDDRHNVYGFDVFTGLPEAWRTGFPAGEFAQDGIPEVAGAGIVAGLFADTVPGFLDEHPGPVAFAHLDADLYSSTAAVLDLLSDRIVPGTVLLFDEFFNYPGWQNHEFRAWREFVARTGVRFEYLAYTGDHEQVAVRITDRPHAAESPATS